MAPIIVNDASFSADKIMGAIVKLLFVVWEKLMNVCSVLLKNKLHSRRIDQKTLPAIKLTPVNERRDHVIKLEPNM